MPRSGHRAIPRSGALLRTFTVAGQDLSQPHGVQVAANDAAGRLLLLDKTSGRIIRLDPSTGAQALYSQVPDLPLCSSAPAGAQCSPALIDQAPMPDYAAWGPDGSLYVTDYQQAVIWRIPPGGGPATVWLADRRLDGGPFGTACIVMMPDHHALLFDQASNGGLGSTSPATGKLVEVPIEPGGAPGPLSQLWESGAGDAPDGCALAASGDIYVALVGASNQIAELDSAGHELGRFGQQFTGSDGGPMPFDSPSRLAFDGTQLLIANQSYFAGTPPTRRCWTSTRASPDSRCSCPRARARSRTLRPLTRSTSAPITGPSARSGVRTTGAQATAPPARRTADQVPQGGAASCGAGLLQ